jgi:hypothetical protein
VADDAVGAHQPLHALAVYLPAAAAQLGVDAWRPVGAVRAGVDGPDLGDQPDLLPPVGGPFLRGAGDPGVVRGPGHSNGLAGGGHRDSCSLLGVDAAVARHGVDCSLTQKATSFEQVTLHPQAGVLPLQLTQPCPLVAGQSGTLAAVDLGLADPVA